MTLRPIVLWFATCCLWAILTVFASAQDRDPITITAENPAKVPIYLRAVDEIENSRNLQPPPDAPSFDRFIVSPRLLDDVVGAFTDSVSDDVAFGWSCLAEEPREILLSTHELANWGSRGPIDLGRCPDTTKVRVEVAGLEPDWGTRLHARVVNAKPPYDRGPWPWTRVTVELNDGAAELTTRPGIELLVWAQSATSVVAGPLRVRSSESPTVVRLDAALLDGELLRVVSCDVIGDSPDSVRLIPASAIVDANVVDPAQIVASEGVRRDDRHWWFPAGEFLSFSDELRDVFVLARFGNETDLLRLDGGAAPRAATSRLDRRLTTTRIECRDETGALALFEGTCELERRDRPNSGQWPRFQFRDAPPPLFVLEGIWTCTIVAKDGRVGSLELRVGDLVRRVVVLRCGELSGSVKLIGDSKQSEEKIQILAERLQEEFHSPSDPRVVVVEPEDGVARFHFEHVMPGTYRIRASRRGGLPERQLATAIVDASAKVDLGILTAPPEPRRVSLRLPDRESIRNMDVERWTPTGQCADPYEFAQLIQGATEDFEAMGNFTILLKDRRRNLIGVANGTATSIELKSPPLLVVRLDPSVPPDPGGLFGFELRVRPIDLVPNWMRPEIEWVEPQGGPITWRVVLPMAGRWEVDLCLRRMTRRGGSLSSHARAVVLCSHQVSVTSDGKCRTAAITFAPSIRSILNAKVHLQNAADWSYRPRPPEACPGIFDY